MTPLSPAGTRRAIRAWLAALLLLASCGSKDPATTIPIQSSPQPDTTLGAGDLFDVRVFGEKDLTGAYRVDSNGTIDFPLVGTIEVKGLTATDVADKLERLLEEGEFLFNPQISILVKEYNSKKVSVFGQVKKPGTFPYHNRMTVVEAISLAGGFTSMAKTDNTTVIRGEGDAQQRYSVPVEDIGRGRAANFLLRSGDIVFVPERIF
ncbi:MAG: polysaccharide biosynthesis/export family protein [Polyangia bacterium]